GQLGHQGQVLADVDAGYVGRNRLERPFDISRSVRLEVPGIEVARRADQEQHDAVLDLGLRFVDGAGRLQPEEVGQVQAHEACSAHLEEASPREAATNGDLDIADVQHEYSSDVSSPAPRVPGLGRVVQIV